MSARVLATTRHAGVIGDPVRHSLSPVLHNAAYEAMGLDLSYGAYAVPTGNARQALHGARALGFVGLSVTTPHKDDVALACDQRTHRVEALGAANCVVFAAGVSIAESTDGEGLLADLARAWDFDPAGARCVILGAGGAARAIALALGEAKAGEVVVVNRTPARAVRVTELAGGIGRIGSLEDLGSADLVLNATSLGLGQDQAAERAQHELAERLGEGQRVVDLVYRPARTAFLARAAELGATVRNGLGMLVHQAARQVELFTDQAAPLEVMWQSVRDEPTS